MGTVNMDCWVIECDGGCGDTVPDQSSDLVCWTSKEAVGNEALENGWDYRQNGLTAKWYCPICIAYVEYGHDL